LTQIAFDKFDPEHSIRRRVARRNSSARRPVFLLPSAYINVSRTAIAYAAMLPSEQFLLVAARRGAKMASLPANVQMISLDSYFRRRDKTEFEILMEKLDKLRDQVGKLREFRIADALGVFHKIPTFMRWGVAARDAWMRLFESENIVG